MKHTRASAEQFLEVVESLTLPMSSFPPYFDRRWGDAHVCIALWHTTKLSCDSEIRKNLGFETKSCPNPFQQQQNENVKLKLGGDKILRQRSGERQMVCLSIRSNTTRSSTVCVLSIHSQLFHEGCFSAKIISFLACKAAQIFQRLILAS